MGFLTWSPATFSMTLIKHVRKKKKYLRANVSERAIATNQPELFFIFQTKNE